MPRSIPACSLALIFLIAGCSRQQMAHDLGFSRDSPDEFEVTTRAPLSMPTSLDLPPPQPGAARPQEISSRLAAEAALAPSVLLHSDTAQDSSGQNALVASAGPAPPANIRNTVDEEAAKAAHGSTIGGTLAFWRAKQPPGRVIDPAAEAALLRAHGIPTLSAAP
jgi:hypothetical protein